MRGDPWIGLLFWLVFILAPTLLFGCTASIYAYAVSPWFMVGAVIWFVVFSALAIAMGWIGSGIRTRSLVLSLLWLSAGFILAGIYSTPALVFNLIFLNKFMNN